MAPKSKVVKPGGRQPRLLVYSRPKKGKTLISATAPNVLVLDPEHGTDWLEGTKNEPDTWHISGWEDVDEAYRFLSESKEAAKYEWIALDGLTKIAQYALRWIIRIRGERALDQRPNKPIPIKYRGDANEMVMALMQRFHMMYDVGILFTAQERVMPANEGSEEDGDEDAEDAQMLYVPDLSKGLRNSVTSLVDVIGRLYVVPDPDRKGRHERRLWVAPNVAYDTGYRSRFVLPPYIRKPTVPRIVATMKEGKSE